ncbi:MAG: SDR family NAD(P)-dependent oxidoreductase [Kangiellaceae bacterium]|nr:SDR family NAD(P)-dependent oxidoreductase [Kangiellaceae bacterium]
MHSDIKSYPDIKSKVFWITGASSGIGKELAIQLSKLGARLILSSRNEGELLMLKNRLANDKHLVLPMDLSVSSQISDATTYVKTQVGIVDYLVNNAGISQRSLCLDTCDEVDRRIMEVDYFGTIKLTKLVTQQMVEIGKGTIINIASIAGKVGSPYRSAYSGAKHALIGFMDCLRAEVAESGIRVLVVCPGWIQTNISKNALTGNMTKFNRTDQEIESGIPVDKAVAKLIKAICSKKEEVVIATGMPWLAYHARRLFPNKYHRLLRKIYKKK